MKRLVLVIHLSLIALLFSCRLFAQNPENWTSKQLMQPADLAEKITANKDVPLIISVGPAAPIPNSIDIGMAKEKENIEKLRKELSALPTDKSVVIYCGCCPFEHCPNVRPAINALKELGFTNYKLLNLPKNIKTDWMDKGYPVVKQ